MVGLYSLKSIALAGLALTLSRVSVATDVIEFDIAENIDRRLDSSWNFWSYLMFDVFPPGLCCDLLTGEVKQGICPPPPPCDAHKCSERNADIANGKSQPRHPCCKEDCMAYSSGGGSSGGRSSSGTTNSDSDEKSETVGATGEGASVMMTWWLLAAAAATVGLIGAAIVMRKRRNKDEVESDSAFDGAVSKRAALLLEGGAVADGAGAGAVAGSAAAMPTFVNFPSFRRCPSGIEIDNSGAVIDTTPSTYYEMEGGEGAIDRDQLPDGVEITRSGTLAPYGTDV